MAKQEITCEDILKELKAKHYAPIYYLMGEEPYYIDVIADYIAEHVLTETEKEFNPLGSWKGTLLLLIPGPGSPKADILKAVSWMIN